MLLKNAECFRRNFVGEYERSGEKIIRDIPFTSYIEGAIWKAQSEAELQFVVQQSHLHDQELFCMGNK